MRKRALTVTLCITALFLMASLVHAEGKKIPDVCKVCGKEIGTEGKKFSAFNREDQDPYSFDDLAHAKNFRNKLCTTNQYMFDGTAQAYDYYTEAPVYMSDAIYVRNSGIPTPGGSGLVAFKDRAGAERFTSEKGG